MGEGGEGVELNLTFTNWGRWGLNQKLTFFDIRFLLFNYKGSFTKKI